MAVSIERVCNLIYSFFFYEEARLQSEVNNRYSIMCKNEEDLLCIENYKQSVQRFNDFKELESRVFDLLKRL